MMRFLLKRNLFLTISKFLILCCTSCHGQVPSYKSYKEKSPKKTASYPVEKTEQEWQKILTPQQFYILRKSGTERAFTGMYYNHHKKGTYICAGCRNPLYESKHKINSGTGWPSFDRAIPKSLALDVDYKIGYARRELKCKNCGGHLGHQFSDGPRHTTGQRHCINSGALLFVETSSSL